MTTETIQERISIAIESSRLSKAEVSRRLQTTPQAVNGWIKTGTIKKSTLVQLAKLTGFNSEWIATGEGLQKPPLDNDAHQSTGQRLKHLRELKGFTLQQVGNRFGCTRSAISSWERGDTRPDLDKLANLARLYSVSVNYLLTGTDDRKSESKKVLDNEEKTPLLSPNAGYLVKLIEEADGLCAFEDSMFMGAISTLLIREIGRK